MSIMSSGVPPYVAPFTANNSYTDTDLWLLYRAAMAAISQNQSYQINVAGGTRTLTRANLSEVWKILEELERRIDAANARGSGSFSCNYARLGRWGRY